MIALQLKRYGRWAVVIGLLMIVATAVGLYIATKQRLPIPFQDRYELKAEFAGASGVTPGLGLPVNVAGVKVGQISGLELEDGVAVVSMAIDPAELPKVYSNARASLVPNTPLKDMQVHIEPGGPPADPLPDGGRIGLAGTTVPVDADELLSALDADTRDYFELLIGNADQSTRERGDDLNQLLKSLAPTTEQVAPIFRAFARRRKALQRMVSNLSQVSEAVGAKDEELARLVDGASTTVQALASQEAALRASVAKLPGTLESTERALTQATRLASELGPTLRALEPALDRLPAALRAGGPVAARAEQVLRKDVRPLVEKLQPIGADLKPTTSDLTELTPMLSSTFQVLNHVVNELAFNPQGDDEGFLYWLAWFAHNGASFLSTEDAHGGAWRGFALVSCGSLAESPELSALLQGIIGPLPGCAP